MCDSTEIDSTHVLTDLQKLHEQLEGWAGHAQTVLLAPAVRTVAGLMQNVPQWANVPQNQVLGIAQNEAYHNNYYEHLSKFLAAPESHFKTVSRLGGGGGGIASWFKRLELSTTLAQNRSGLIHKY